MVREFTADADYQSWLTSHPTSLVVNTYRMPSPSYLMLHRSTCRTISGVPARGSRWTGGDYGKFGAEDRADLERWARDKIGGTVTPCSRCRP